MKTIPTEGGLNYPIYDATAKERSRQTWQHHIDAWNERDLDRLMQDYTNESVLVMKDYIYRGKREIRQAFENLFAKFNRAENTGIDRIIFENVLVYITWCADFSTHSENGIDSFVIKDGKITTQTIEVFHR